MSTVRSLLRARWSLVAAVVALAPSTAWAECPPDCDLAALRSLALDHAPEVDSAEARVSFSEARYDEARFAAANIGRFDLGAYPTPMRLGDVASSAQPDISFSSEMGLFATFRIEGALAITPWWQIVELWRAARGGVEMSESEVDLARGRVVIAVERAYRDAQIASESIRAIRRARRQVGQALAHVERLLDEDLPGADETDRLRLEVTMAGFDARIAEIGRDRRLALTRLRRLAGLPRGSRLTPAPLSVDSTDIAPLDWYLETARRRRPEVRLSLAGVNAASALVRARQAEVVPELAIGAFYGFRRTPVVDDQTSPFVSDPWNGQGVGYGLVFRWAPSPGVAAARILEARADLAYARAMRRHALGGVAYEVEEAYINAVEDDAVARVRAQALDIATRRFDEALADLSQGRSSPGDVSRAAQDWVSQELSHLSASGRALVSRALLDLATGTILPERD